MKTGKLPENVLKRSVLNHIGKREKEVQSGAGIGRDCAILAFPEEEGLAVSMQEAAVLGKGRNKPFSPASASSVEPFITLGGLMQKCANNLAAGGSRPFAFMVTLLMPEDTEEGEVRNLMAEAEAKAEEIAAEIEELTKDELPSDKKPAVKIVGGQTRITGGVAYPYAVITGFGKHLTCITGGDRCRREGKDRKQGIGVQPWQQTARPGQDVVLSKWIGLQGTAVLAERNRERLSTRYPGWLAEEAAGFGRYLSVLPEAEIAVKAGVGAMHDASEGGILGALWELAEGAGTGLTVDMRKLPLRQETVEVCECCNVNPYELLSGGCLIMTAEDGPGLAEALARKGIPAAVVGKVTDSNDRILINGEEIRYMDRPQRDGIYHG